MKSFTTSRMSTRHKIWLFHIMAVFFAVLIAIPVCELAIRITLTLCYHNTLAPAAHPPTDPGKEVVLGQLMHADPNPKLLYRLWPGARTRFRGVTVETNAMGFRDDLVTTGKPSRTLRVVGLGDSSMFGFGVAREACYLKLLQAEFRDLLRGRWNVEFINTGIPGYNSTQEVELFFQTGLKLDPDAVLIQFDDNDLDVPLTAPVKPDFLRARYFFLAHLPTLMTGSFFDLRAFYILEQRDRLHNLDYPDAGWGAVQASYRRLADVCRQRKIPLFGLLICEDTPPLSEHPRPNPTHQRILELWRTLGIQAIQMLPRVEAQYCKDQQDWIHFTNSTADPHPNPAGHALIAQSVLPILCDALLKKAGIAPESLDRWGALGNIALRQLTALGLHEAEDWDGYRINWSGPQAHFHFIPNGGRVVVPLMISHPDVSAAKPVKITIRIDGTPTARHPLATRTVQFEVAKAGYTSQVIDIHDLDGSPLDFTLNVDRTFHTDRDPRPLGVGIYSLNFLP